MQSLLQQDVPEISWHLTSALILLPTLAFISTPSAHTLQIRSASWLYLWVLCVTRVGLGKPWQARAGRWAAYIAGVLLALGHICERTSHGDLFWVKVLLPATLYILDHSVWPSESKLRSSVLGTLTWSGLACTYHIAGRNPATTIGLAYAAILPIALRLVNTAFVEHNGRKPDLYVLQDVALAAGAFCLPFAVIWEPWSTGLSYSRVYGDLFGSWWEVGQPVLRLTIACLGGIVQAASDGIMICLAQRSYTSVAMLLASGGVVSQIVVHFAFFRLWFAALFAATFTPVRHERGARVLTAVACLSLVLLLGSPWLNGLLYSSQTYGHSNLSFDAAPLQLLDKHPIEHLLATERSKWNQKVQGQSKSLDAAVHEYHRRYGMWPPPNFDRWYEYAVSREVQLIDEYDMIYDCLLPFWGLEPQVIRLRLEEAMGNRENQLIALLIRDKQAAHIEGGRPWQEQAVVGLIERFVEHLPDMDIALNVLDEPRVILPHDELARLISLGKQAIAGMSDSPSKQFSTRVLAERIEEVRTSRFNTVSRQHAWTPSKMSCPPDSPARVFDEALPADNLTAYALTDLCFIYNQTAFSDVCNSPSFASSHGFFERPNAFSIVHDLIPVFSQSKVSTYQDILYPSPWYWYEKVRYSEADDMPWDQKLDQLYWRGSTTGGFSQAGGWRRHHRQRLVGQLNANDQAFIMPNTTIESIDRSSFGEMIDVKFSKVGQCEATDCKAEKEFFTIAPSADQNEAWSYRYLLDLDGNAFSGRFYAFMQSKSITFKMAVFREWHEHWIAPWVHYIPLSLRGTETLEAVRWFSQSGQQEGQAIARESSDWARTALRDVDMEVYLFRLLLEYARVLDDDRQHIGFR